MAVGDVSWRTGCDRQQAGVGRFDRGPDRRTGFRDQLRGSRPDSELARERIQPGFPWSAWIRSGESGASSEASGRHALEEKASDGRHDEHYRDRRSVPETRRLLIAVTAPGRLLR